jgi:hypothetical protein
MARKLDYFPRDGTVTPVNEALLDSVGLNVGDENVQVYRLLIPFDSWTPGARTFDQFDRQNVSGRYDASLFQLFLAQVVRKGNFPMGHQNRKGALLTVSNINNQAWLFTLREKVLSANELVVLAAAGDAAPQANGKQKEEANKTRARKLDFGYWIGQRLGPRNMPEIFNHVEARDNNAEWDDLFRIIDSDAYMKVCAFYMGLSIQDLQSDMKEWTATQGPKIACPVHPLHVFKMDHAQQRWKRQFHSEGIDTDFDILLNDLEHPNETFVIPYDKAYPTKLGTYFMPNFEAARDYHSSAYKRFQNQYKFSGKSEDEIRRLFESQAHFNQLSSATISIDEYTKKYQSRVWDVRNGTPQEIMEVKQACFNEFNSVFNDWVDAGTSFFKKIFLFLKQDLPLRRCPVFLLLTILSF